MAASPMPGNRIASELESLLRLARPLYSKCRDANESYRDIGREVYSVHKLLRHLKADLDEQTLLDDEILPLLAECRSTLSTLDGLVKEYYAKNKSNTERLRLRNSDLDQLGSLRVKLVNHQMGLRTLLDKAELDRARASNENGSSQRDKELEALYDKVDAIAARLAQRAGSTVTLEDDGEEIWKQFQRELDSEGVPDAIFAKYKSQLRSYIRKLDQDGILNENPNSSRARQPALSLNTSQWLDSIASSSTNYPNQPRHIPVSPSTDSAISIKELNLASREQNIKFPQSMKDQRLRPRDVHDASSPRDSRQGWNDSSSRALIRVPEPEIISTALILASDFDDEQKANRQPPPSSRRFSDQSDRAAPHSPIVGSPTSPRGSVSFGDAYSGNRSGPVHGTTLAPSTGSNEGSLYGASPRSSAGTLPNYGASPRTSTNFYGSSPAVSSGRNGTARDSGIYLGNNGDNKVRGIPADPKYPQGRSIPADATWTKVRRNLVSLSILAEDRLRYEARPEYVAILGVISREQLQNLVDRSHVLRESRRRRPGSRSSHDTPASLPKAQTFPIPVVAPPVREPPMAEKNRVRFKDDDLKSSSDSESDTNWSPEYDTEPDTESSSGRNDRRRPAPAKKGRGNGRERVNYRPSQMGPGRSASEPMNIYPSSAPSDRDRDRNRDRERERERERDRERKDRDHYLSPSTAATRGDRRGSNGSEDRRRKADDREGSRERRDSERGERGERGEHGAWGQRIKVGGFGAAAGAALSVLTDAVVELATAI